MNLIPNSVRVETVCRRLVRRWAAALSGASLLLLAVAACQHDGWRRAERDGRRHDEEEQSVRGMLERTTQLSRSLQQLERRQVELERLTLGPTPLTLLGAVVAAGKETGGEIVVTQLSSTLQERRVAEAAAGSKAGRDKSVQRVWLIELTGRAADDPAISRFVARLQDTSVFEKVELKSTLREDEGGRVRRQYQIAAEIVCEIPL